MLNVHMRKLALVISVFTVLFVLYHLSYSLSNNSVNHQILTNTFSGDRHLHYQYETNPKYTEKQEAEPQMDESRGKYSDSIARSPPLFSGQKIVHFDLKGAPPKVSYYKEIFPILRSIGATGLLMEYEDMFPYSSSDIKASNAYSMSDIRAILNAAEENQLEVIPLVQTFGHLEFILKLKEYTHLREVQRYPQVICPSRNGTRELLTGMIDDVMALHPTSSYLHIGCDEVYNLAECTACQDTLLRNNWTKQQLFLNHVATIAGYIKEKYPKVKPLMWDDEFRKMSLNELITSRVGGLVEPVVWKYTRMLDSFLPEDIWDKYAAVFGSVWIASAFKGATGSDKFVTDISYHLENHRAWMRLVSAYRGRVAFKGLMVTGWQRYDHFAVLCELLPVGLPSLAVNLAYVSQSDLEMQHVPRWVLDLLKCGPGLLSPRSGTRCQFPGSVVYDKASQLSSLMDQADQLFDASQVKGWMTEYNVHTGFSSPAHVEAGTGDLDRLKMELMYLEQEMTRAMEAVFEQDTAREWVFTFIRPMSLRLQALWDAKEKLLATTVWPRRPLAIHDQLGDRR